ncbi:hypothetical protein [Caldimonas sp. KR1-144]|uniref:hypothetical protein n=1 Tax=Caldimonas sp. KR1-144 TaxID=3400911 RepID=UPI003BFCD6E8
MIKRISAAVALVACAALPAQATDVGVSVSIGQPGFYGRIDIGNYPQPALIYPQPMVIQPAPVGVVYQPMYLNVPPGHAKNWAKHCGRYNACGRPVYFVKNEWYEQTYVPAYQQRHGGGKGKGGEGHGNGKGHGKGKGHD